MTQIKTSAPVRGRTLAFATVALACLAACAPPPPPAASGVGFGDYESYLANRGPENVAREAQLRGEVDLPPEATGAPSASTGNPTNGVSASDLAAAGIGVQDTTGAQTPTPIGAPAPAAPQEPLAAPGIQTASAAPTAVAPATADPVIRRETAAPASAAAPAAAAAPVAPAPAAAAPVQAASARNVASASDGPDIVAFALSTQHAVGARQYDRGLLSRSQAGRNCGRFHGADQAQRAFLEAGGPFRDRYGLDPDGDGFACGWSPEPFRAAVRG